MYKYLKMNNLKSRLLLTVHDEIIVELHHTEKHVAPILRWLMSEFEEFRVPISAGAEKGIPNWGAKVDIGDEIGFTPLSKDEVAAIDAYSIW